MEKVDPYRRSGRTTRLINQMIEELLGYGHCLVRDHTKHLEVGTYSEMLRKNTSIIVRRVEIEHRIKCSVKFNTGIYEDGIGSHPGKSVVTPKITLTKDVVRLSKKH